MAPKKEYQAPLAGGNRGLRLVIQDDDTPKQTNSQHLEESELFAQRAFSRYARSARSFIASPSREGGLVVVDTFAIFLDAFKAAFDAGADLKKSMAVLRARIDGVLSAGGPADV